MSITKLTDSREEKAISRRAKDNILIHVRCAQHSCSGRVFIISCVSVLKSHICAVFVRYHVPFLQPVFAAPSCSLGAPQVRMLSLGDVNNRA